MEKKSSNIIKFTLILLCFILGICTPKLAQFQTKSVETYKQAMENYNKNDFQNAYYLFSKIGRFSSLKPAALYRQAMCAKQLNDKKSELSAYEKLIKNYPTNELAKESKYNAGILLRDSSPDIALKYFKSVMNSSSKKDYKIASMYHYARILVKQKKTSDKKIDKYFSNYLKEYPNGKFALENAKIFEKYKNNLSSYDYTLITRVYYANKMYNEAQQIFPQTSLEDSWAIQASNNYKLGNIKKAQFLTEIGVANFGDNVEYDDYKRAITFYLNSYKDDKTSAIARLYKIAKGSKKDYIWFLKCENLVNFSDRSACYSNLTKSLPKSQITRKVLEKEFYDGIKTKNYDFSYKVGKKYLESFENVKLQFWMGKISSDLGLLTESDKYFKDLIKKYPDTYYAYRATILTNGYDDAMLPDETIEFKPVEYPYKQNKFIKKMISINDYEIIAKIYDDDFVKSWAQYMQGDYATSMHSAKIAMDKIKNKPPKTDLRWRLVYPLNYYNEIVKYSEKYGNDTALIYGIVREESYFNKSAGSSVGALGLMQLMPTTAIETAIKSGLHNFSINDLYIPSTNIMLGNIYYSQLRSQLDNKNISAVASYNGGIGSVYNWQKTLNYKDTDDFVEQIPYPETKNYVKKVFRTYWNYKRIYN